ncbi:MAG: hypothetical protein EP297_16140 [Gammaproteobacteria bacterium]|nr:MAG: hypothetical protein EP297_16140 [Gammaproteobacteria bacterium]
MVTTRFSWQNFLIRFLFAILLVFSTYNPTDFSYYDWVLNNFPSNLNAVSAFAGIILIIGWTIYLRATWNSLGPFGLLLALAFFVAFIWLIIDAGWLVANKASVLTWIGLFIFSGVLAVGMSWSHIRRRLTGQIDIDDVED